MNNNHINTNEQVRRYGYTALAHCAIFARVALGSKPLTILLRKRLAGPAEGGDKSNHNTNNSSNNTNSNINSSDMRAYLCTLSWAVVAAAATSSSSNNSSMESSLRR